MTVAYRGLTADPVKTVHEAVHDELPGEVEVWDIVAPDPKDTSKEGWDAPFDTARESSPAIKLAAKIGRTVRRWCNAGTRPRDVLDPGAPARPDLRGGDPRAQA